MTSTEDCVGEGSLECAPPPQDIEIEQSIAHKEYNSNNKDNDIALLKLSKDVSISEYVNPICLPRSDELRKKDYAGLNLTVAGWGETVPLHTSDVKMKVQVPVKSNDACAKLLFPEMEDFVISETKLCAGGVKGEDSCKGDSGSPLMFNDGSNWYAIGLVSYGRQECGAENAPGRYTRVTKYIEWIEDTLKEMESH